MTASVEGTRPVARPDEPVRVEPTPTSTPVVNPSGVSGVAIYDRGADVATDSSVRPVGSIHQDPAPITSQSKGNIIAWIIGIVILIVLVYFMWQIFF